MDSAVTRWRRKKWELYAVTFYERSTLLNSKWINFHLPRFIQSRKRFLIRPPLEEIMATFSVPAIKMLRGFYYPSFPFLLSFSRFSSLEIVDFDGSSRSRFVNYLPLRTPLLFVYYSRNVEEHYKLCFCFILIIIPR